MRYLILVFAVLATFPSLVAQDWKVGPHYLSRMMRGEHHPNVHGRIYRTEDLQVTVETIEGVQSDELHAVIAILDYETNEVVDIQEAIRMPVRALIERDGLVAGLHLNYKPTEPLLPGMYQMELAIRDRKADTTWFEHYPFIQMEQLPPWLQSIEQMEADYMGLYEPVDCDPRAVGAFRYNEAGDDWVRVNEPEPTFQFGDSVMVVAPVLTQTQQDPSGDAHLFWEFITWRGPKGSSYVHEAAGFYEIESYANPPLYLDLSFPRDSEPDRYFVILRIFDEIAMEWYEYGQELFIID